MFKNYRKWAAVLMVTGLTLSTYGGKYDHFTPEMKQNIKILCEDGTLVTQSEDFKELPGRMKVFLYWHAPRTCKGIHKFIADFNAACEKSLDGFVLRVSAYEDGLANNADVDWLESDARSCQRSLDLVAKVPSAVEKDTIERCKDVVLKRDKFKKLVEAIRKVITESPTMQEYKKNVNPM